MDKHKEARSAFKLLEMLGEIESILWERYCNEFLELLIDDNPSQRSSEHIQNDSIPF